jgi:hypothetical protein
MRLRSRFFALLGICLVSLLATGTALAFPPLPSSFYGTVKVNGANVPDGTPVKAVIDGQTYGEAQTQTYQGDSVYSLDIKGDDLDTSAIDGGKEGDTIVFMIGKETAEQTGTWQGGTNTNLNLSVSSIAGQETPDPALTQAATSSEGGPTATEMAPLSAELTGPASTSETAANPDNEPVLANNILWVTGILVGAAILVYILWFFLRRKPKA